MDVFVTVIVVLAVIAAGAFLIHRLNSQHGERTAAFYYDRGGVVAPDRKPTDSQPVHHRGAEANGGGERRDGGRGRLRPRRRPHKRPEH
ncbi:hypothetical protein [Streptomyces sp. NPDC006997]|uniref:hypothetical protein n=1 Tax=Streptomyces sp. NPDC006997 TaxID=3155356 RepID=UPI0033F735FF